MGKMTYLLAILPDITQVAEAFGLMLVIYLSTLYTSIVLLRPNMLWLSSSKMHRGMFRLAHYLQIFQTVILWVIIFVVNDLFARQLSAKCFLNDESVFAEKFSVGLSNKYITAYTRMSSAFPVSSSRAARKGAILSPRATLENVEPLETLWTNFLNLTFSHCR